MPEWMMRSLTDTYTYTCQLEPQERPVDKFHFDYVPFVFVTMLRKVRDGREPNGWVRAGECEPTYQRNHDVQARGDDTGKLVLQPSDGEQQGGKLPWRWSRGSRCCSKAPTCFTRPTSPSWAAVSPWSPASRPPPSFSPTRRGWVGG